MKIIILFFLRHFVFFTMVGILVTIGAILYWDAGATQDATTYANTSPSVLCTEGKTMVRHDASRVVLKAQERQDIIVGDTIQTLPNSKATIFWGDGNITRLAEKSSIQIVSLGKGGETKTDFSLQSGKTYTRIFKYLSEKEYFHERYNDGNQLAAVRGTAFEVNMDGGYVKTMDHALEILTASGQNIAVLPEGKAIAIGDVSKKVLDEVIDLGWEKFNKEADVIAFQEYLLQIRRDFAPVKSKVRSIIDMVVKTKEALPFETTFSGGVITVRPTIDAKTLLSDNATYERVEEFYRRAAGAWSGYLDIPSKEYLRTILLEAASEERKKALSTEFLRESMYDSWGATNETKKAIEESMQQYITNGADKAFTDAVNVAKGLQKAASENPANTIVTDAVNHSLDSIVTIDEMKEDAQKLKETISNLPQVEDAKSKARDFIQDAAKRFQQ